MEPRQVLLWAPRILGVLLALLLWLFAFDVWSMPGTFWERLGGFLLHSLPTILLLAAAGLGWRSPRWGGIAWLACAAAAVLLLRDPFGALFVALPAVIIGLLFLTSAPARSAR